MASKKPMLGKKVNRATEVMNSPMGKAFQSAQGSDSGKPIGKAMKSAPPAPPTLKAPKPQNNPGRKKGPAEGGKPVDRQYQGGSGSTKYPKNIPDGYTVLTLMSNPPKYKLVPKSGK
jgi:hypothetical protein